MFDIVKYFTDNGVINLNGVFMYKDRRHRTKRVSPTITATDLVDTRRVVDICEVVHLLTSQGIHPNRVDNSLLTNIIRDYLGYKRNHASKITHSIRAVKESGL